VWQVLANLAFAPDQFGLRPDAERYLARVIVPALSFRAGRQDPAAVAAWERAQFKHPYSKAVAWEGTGHWLHQERPAEFNAILTELIAGFAVGPLAVSHRGRLRHATRPRPRCHHSVHRASAKARFEAPPATPRATPARPIRPPDFDVSRAEEVPCRSADVPALHYTSRIPTERAVPVTDETPTRPEGKAIILRMSWEPAEREMILFADQMLVQAQGDIVLITIGQTVHPAISGPDDPRADVLAERGTVDVRPIARVALSHSAAARFAKAFATIAKNLPDVPEETLE
jgi:hypothetical protein